MKKNVILTACLLLSQFLCAQRQNLDKLPQKERDFLLVEIANEAIARYSSGYLRPGDKPYIEDIGFKLNEEYKLDHHMAEYLDRYHYAVCYLASEKEKEAYYNHKYRVRAIILADVGKVTTIEYMDDCGWRVYALEKLAPDYHPAYIRKFKPAEEVLREREERRIKEQKEKEEWEKRRKLEYEKKYREFEEMKKRRKDSLRQRYLMKQDSIRREDSIRSIQGTAGMQK